VKLGMSEKELKTLEGRWKEVEREGKRNLESCGVEFVPVREWMRICFKLLDLLKAHKKVIRCAAVNSFGNIAKSLGPQDVLSVLLLQFLGDLTAILCLAYYRV